MSSRSDDSDSQESLPSTLLERIMSVCDRFELEWKAGERPSIEQFLQGCEQPDALFRHLLRLEFDLRERAGERPSLDEYRSRFADRNDILEATLAERPPAGDETTLGEGRRPPTSDFSSTRTDLDQSAIEPGSEGKHRSGSSSRWNRRRFDLVRLHARGGVGEIWLARDRDLGREVALKRLHEPTARSASMRARFLREAWITGQLQHPGIVPIFELSKSEDGQLYYTMRFIRGRTLTESAVDYHRRRDADERGGAEPRGLLGAFVGVCRVVAYAHSRGIIHRDLKGQNIALGDFGEVMVLDWGMAKVIGMPEPDPGAEAPDAASRVECSDREPDPGCRSNDDESWEGTHPDAFLGTPSYMSPEQAARRNDLVGFQSDVYGLGAILYELLTGEPPFRGSLDEVLWQVENEAPRPPRNRVRGIPAPLEAICLKCLAKRPVDRYASATDLADDVQRFLDDEPVSVHAESRLVRSRRWISRHRTLASVILATLIVTTVCLAVATTFLKLANDRESRLLVRAEESLGLAYDVIDRFFGRVGNDRRLKARGLEKLQSELLAEAQTFYSKLISQEGEGPRGPAERGLIDLRLARITEELGSLKDAITHAEGARSTFEGLTRKSPGNLEHQKALAQALDVLGVNYSADHQLERAQEALRLSRAAWERLVRDNPNAIDLRMAYVASLNRFGRISCLVLNDQEEARSVLQRSLDIRGTLASEGSESPELLNLKAEAMLLLGYSWAWSDFAKARPLLDQALDIRERLAASESDWYERGSDLLDACVLIATAYSNARVPGSVPKLYERIRKNADKLAEEHPDIPRLNENRCLVELLVAIHQAHGGDYQAATRAAEQALKRAPESGLARLYAACSFSLASAAVMNDAVLQEELRARLNQQYRARAIALLRLASETGLLGQPHQLMGLRSNDPDFDPLRDDPDFQSLLDELDAKPKTN